MLAPHVAQANAPAKLRRESRAGDVAGFFSASVPGNEQLRPRHGRFPVEELQASKPPVCMPARADPLHDFLARIAAFFVIDVGEFQSRFVRNIFVVVILSKPGSPELQANRIESFHSSGSSSQRADTACQLLPYWAELFAGNNERSRGMAHPRV